MAAPDLSTPANMATTYTASTLVVTFDDKSTRSFELAYRPSSSPAPRCPTARRHGLAGGYYDINNQPIIDSSVAGSERQFFSDCPDGTSLIQLDGASVAGVKGKPVFAVVQFEYTTRNQALARCTASCPRPSPC
jgi:hypothetical protein